jgi:hypothetical protein
LNISARAGIAGVLASLAVSGTASAVDVTVRVEGGTKTLVGQTLVTPSASVKVDKTGSGGTTCSGTSGGGALELATGGDWGGKAFSFGGPPSQAVEAIKGESYPFSQTARFWSFSVNNSPAPVGICDYTPKQGDEILLYAGCGDATTACFADDPLDVSAPVTVKPGVPFNVSVGEYTSPFGKTPTKAPSAGAMVTGGAAAATTGATGVASVTVSARGPVILTATKGSKVRDEVTVCSSDGADGYCGYAIPTPGPTVTPTPTVAPDVAPPAVSITGLRRKYKTGKGPRTLTASVTDDASGVADVKLSLVRTRGKKCAGFGDTKGKFRKITCGQRRLFSVGSDGAVSYLLPKQLGPGAYTFTVIGTDKAGNRFTAAQTFRVN